MANKILKKLDTRKASKWFWGIVITPFALLFLLLFLVWIGAFGKLPTFEELENPKSNLATEIYSEDGAIIGSFFVQNRSFVDYEDISPNLTAALVSTEDMRFYSHSGIDFIALARVAVRTVGLGQGQGGGSTISQQVAKNLYPRDPNLNNNKFTKGPKLVIAKLKEWITALMLEHNYTKEEIIAMYLNTMEYGSNAWGIKSASRTFFNKTPDEVNIQEAAVLVGVVNAPTRYSPVRNPERSLARRNLVLSRMKDMGYLTKHQRDSIAAMPIELDLNPITHNDGLGTYFREMLRQTMTAQRPTRRQFAREWDYQQAVDQWDTNPIYGWVHKNLKSDGTPYNLYRDGLKIYTTINAVMQAYAEESLVNHMATDVQPAMDAQVKRRNQLFVNMSKEQVKNIMNSAIKQTDRYRNLKGEGLSDEQITANFNTPTEMRVFTYQGERDTVMTPYDSIMHHKRYMRSSFVAMDPSNGHIKAYVGGPEFRYFKYDNAKQSHRQVGSTIKPFVYSFGIDHLNLTPCTMVPNYEVTIETPSGPWAPREAGPVERNGELHPLKWGLAMSRNNYSAWIMKQTKNPQAMADYMHKLGIKSYIYPVPSMVLGTPELSLFELVAAYGIFPNRGVYTDPIFVTRIEDRSGNLIATFTPTTHDAISEQTAYTMLQMLQNNIYAGTGGRLIWNHIDKQRTEGWLDVGGKTGTSNDNVDAWFVGVTPKLVAGVWVGGEDQSIHLTAGGEGSSKALPIVGEFLVKVYGNPSLGISKNDKYTLPVGAVIYSGCPDEETGNSYDEGADEFFDN